MERGISVGNEAGVVVIGDGNTVGFGTGTGTGTVVRSAYREQVRRFEHPELVGREEESAELAEFCRTGTGYRWWRADAWAGKAALMTWFVLDPPEGARIVPFFVTARLGAQNDVVAYVDVVLEQLAEPAGEGLPALLTAATREAHLLVSGRLDPPLPADVPEGHPLRDPSIVRLLSSSPKARARRRLRGPRRSPPRS
ncbi:hypothetical protein [Streptomyces sp. NPDC088757]|uniref:hypothetical protein n=1 Tax=Streptomyces sp. NPDC088757 TaxID=3365889 RepID=UPI0037FFB6F4